MVVGWGFVGKHVGEKEKGSVGLSNVYVGSDQRVEEEGGLPFEI